jgi:hypothetical protein
MAIWNQKKENLRRRLADIDRQLQTIHSIEHDFLKRRVIS